MVVDKKQKCVYPRKKRREYGERIKRM